MVGLLGTLVSGAAIALVAVAVGAPELFWRTVFELTVLNPKAQNLEAVRILGYDSGADAPTLFGQEGDASLFKEKSALVVGGTKGIGRGIAIALASRGAAVDIVGRDRAAGAEILRVLAQKNPQSVHRFFGADLSTAVACAKAVKQIAVGAADLTSHDSGAASHSTKTPTSYAALAFTVGVWPNARKPLTDDGVELPLFLDVTARFLVFQHLLRGGMLASGCLVMSVLASGQRTPPEFVGKFLRSDVESVKAKIAAPPAGGWSTRELAGKEASARADARVFIRALAPAVVAHDGMLQALAGQHPGLAFVGTFPGIVESRVTVPTLGETLAAALTAAAGLLGVLQSPEACGERHAQILNHVAALRAGGGGQGALLFDHFMVPRQMSPVSADREFSEWVRGALAAWDERSLVA